MSRKWIVVADSSRARILTPEGEEPRPLDEIIHYVGRAGYTGPEKLSAKHFAEVADLVHPQGSMKPQDVQTDRPGSVKAPGVSGSDHRDFNHRMAEEFAGELVKYLSRARQEHRFDELVLIAPPLFLGVLRKKMPQTLTSLVTEELAKELTKLPSDEIGARLDSTK